MKKISRRSFTKAAASAAFTAQFAATYIPAHAMNKLEKPALVAIGAGGKGRADISGCQAAGFEIVGLVDVIDAKKSDVPDTKRTRGIKDVRKAFSKVRFFTDYREMISELGDKFDAVTVSTPDHHHFHASTLAMQAGKHVYCQKPLTHSIWEARNLASIAKQTGVKTQMGNQAHANDHLRRCVELIRAGVIGKVKEVHAWTNRPIWPQGFQTPPPAEPVPSAVDWDQWVGPAPWVDYSSKIAPFAWRGWWDYGTGALGDMACHIMDMGYWAVMPGSPVSVTAKQNGASKFSPPINSLITWDFAPSQYTSNGGFKFHWYDGFINASFDRDNWNLKKDGNEYNHPDDSVLEGLSFKDYGSVIVGERGKLFFNRSKKKWVVKPSTVMDGFDLPDETLPRAGGNNYAEWMHAIEGKIDQSQSHFGHSGPFTETILLGVLAQRFSETELVWDPVNMEVKGRPDLKKYIQREYRDGWQIKV